MDEPATALGQDGGTTKSMAGDDPAVSWSEGFLNNEPFRWMLPMLGYFVRLLFAFSGFGALVVHIVASTDPSALVPSTGGMLRAKLVLQSQCRHPASGSTAPAVSISSSVIAALTSR